MYEEFEKKHKKNLEQLDGIIISINEYMDLMQKAWDYRIISLRAPAIKKWRELFVSNKKNLQQSFDGIQQSLFILEGIIKNDNSANKFKDILSSTLPNTTNTDLGEVNHNTIVLKQSNDSLIDKAYQLSIKNTAEINTFLPQANSFYQNYTHWLAEIENAKTTNYEPMGLSESLMFKENNYLGRKLISYILSRNFEGLSYIEFMKLVKTKQD